MVHKSGTYEEISADGRHVAMCVANRFDYVKGGLTETIDKNHDYKLSGSRRSSTGGDSHDEVVGKRSSMTTGDSVHITGGDSVHATQGDHVHGVSGKMELRVGGGLKLKFDGKTSDHTPIDVIGDTAANLQLGQTLNINVASDVTETSATNWSITATNQITFTVGSSQIIMTPSAINIVAADIFLIPQNNTWLGQDHQSDKDNSLPVALFGDGPAKKAMAKKA